MSLQENVNEQLKTAMKAKDTVALESLRAIKTAIMMAQTRAGAKELTLEDEIKLVQKLVKQRKESAEIFHQQGRVDLAEPEEAQIKIIEQFLPEQIDEAAITEIVTGIIAKIGAAGLEDMGKVMGLLKSQGQGRVDMGKAGALVKSLLA